LVTVTNKQSYKQERACHVHFLRLLAVCWPGVSGSTLAMCRLKTLFAPPPRLLDSGAGSGGMFNIHLTANLRRNLPVKKIVNQLRFDRIMAVSLWSRFFGPPCSCVVADLPLRPLTLTMTLTVTLNPTFCSNTVPFAAGNKRRRPTANDVSCLKMPVSCCVPNADINGR